MVSSNALMSLRKMLKHVLVSLSPTLDSRRIYRKVFGVRLNLKNPRNFNEKLMWLKLNTYKKSPLVALCADKFRVREYVKLCGCEDILNDLIGVWDSVDTIEWDNLPEKFVLKCNHGQGYNIICTNKENINITEVKAKLRQWMSEDFWKKNAEVHYRYIPKKIICEKYIEPDVWIVPLDYKFFCFNGEPKFLYVGVKEETGMTRTRIFLDLDWRPLNFLKDSVAAPIDIKRPMGFSKMIACARKLSEPFPFVRIDFFDKDGQVIFGEMTFTPSACLATYFKDEVLELLGYMLLLPGN